MFPKPTKRPKKRPKLDREYTKLKTDYLRKHTTCEVCKTATATQVHHTRRRGPYYLRVDTWMPVCLECHAKIEAHPAWAKEQGYLVNQGEQDLREVRNPESQTENQTD